MRPDVADPISDASRLVRLHETIGSLLAARGEWQQAYQHLRAALELLDRGPGAPQPIPEPLRREVDRLRREHAEAREQSLRDALTDSYNRRYLDQRLVTLLAEPATDAAGLSVALLDLDWFKQVNDTFGHLVGDRVLRRVADLLGESLPRGAFCARYGGEEFVLVLPGVPAAMAVDITESARCRVERYPWSAIARGLHVTISGGVAQQHPGTGASDRTPVDAEHQLLEADTLLYAAKQSGRNAVAYRVAGAVRLAGSAMGRRMVWGQAALSTR